LIFNSVDKILWILSHNVYSFGSLHKVKK